MSGLLASQHKSTLFPSGVDVNTKQEIVSRTRLKIGELLVIYLGVPLISTKLKAEDCQISPK